MDVSYIPMQGLKMSVSALNKTHISEAAHHLPHVMMWAAVTSEMITALYFFDVSVSGQSYLGLLSYWVITRTDNTGLLNHAILQQDRVPAHYAVDMHAFIHN
jgi:hypothetical protein